MPYKGTGKIDPQKSIEVTVEMADVATLLKGTFFASTAAETGDLEVIAVRQDHYASTLTVTCLSASFPLVRPGEGVKL